LANSTLIILFSEMLKFSPKKKKIHKKKFHKKNFHNFFFSYAIVKPSQDDPNVYCMTFVYNFD
jgi:hypothetical protein